MGLVSSPEFGLPSCGVAARRQTLLQILALFGKERTREADELLHRHGGVQFLVLRDEADPAADCRGAVGIGDWDSKHLCGAAIGSQQAHQSFDGGGLSHLRTKERRPFPAKYPLDTKGLQCNRRSTWE